MSRLIYAYQCKSCEHIALDPSQYDPCQECGGRFDTTHQVVLKRTFTMKGFRYFRHSQKEAQDAVNQ